MSMTLPPTIAPRAITIVLVTSSILYLGYQLSIALDADDTGRFETTLALSVVGQVERGFGSLYGPFSGENPLVLIHAPLYYRIAGLGALVLTSIAVEPIRAALIAGRLVSVLSLIGLLVAVSRLSELGGDARRSGVLAACLVATSPVLGILPVMVRPDVLAVMLQTAGVFLVARTILHEGQSRTDLALAYAAFALAICAKQHNLVTPTACSLMLLWALWKGRLGLAPIVVAHAVGLAIGGVYLGGEEWITSGSMSRAVFELPGGPFRALNYATWGHVAEIGSITAKKSVGLIAVGAACVWWARRAGGLDRIVLVLLAAEAIAFVPLCLFNRGAADNYALQAVVFAAVLSGRALRRALDATTAPRWRLAPIGLAVLVVLGRDVQLVEGEVRIRIDDRAALGRIAADADRRGETYFVGFPQFNRLHGRVELAHDEWLYGAFESVGAAEPRERWLRPALADGPIRQVVLADDSTSVPGLRQTLPELGYARSGRFGPYRVWRRGSPQLARREGPR